MKLMNVRKFKLSKTWVVLGTALGIGLIAALAARSYLANQMEAIEARAKGSKINVIVAKQDLKKGEKLSTENVAVRPIPADYVHSNAVGPGDFERVDGQALAYPVKAGEMVLWSLMEGRKAPTFSSRVEAGRRAITVPVDEINSISGMLEPGDIVDLMLSVEQDQKKVTLPLVQSLLVLATGQRAVDDPISGERRQYSTVTLDTTPEQAQGIIVAREAGKLTALLRNPQDKQAFTDRKLDMSALLGSQAEKSIPVLYGGRNAKLSPEDVKLGRGTGAARSPMADKSIVILQPDRQNATGATGNNPANRQP